MKGQAEVWYVENSMIVRLLELTDEANDSLVKSGVNVDVEILDQDGNTLGTASLSHQSDGNWEAVVAEDVVTGSVSPGTPIELVFTVDGGTKKTQGQWTEDVHVRER